MPLYLENTRAHLKQWLTKASTCTVQTNINHWILKLNWSWGPSPRNLKELCLFLGFAGYYRQFIQDYSKIVKLLNNLNAGYPPFRSGGFNENSGQYFQPKEPFEGRWTDSCRQAHWQAHHSPSVMFFQPKADNKHSKHTDASTTSLGAELYQEQEGEMCVIAFTSRGLSKSKSHYLSFWH